MRYTSRAMTIVMSLFVCAAASHAMCQSSVVDSRGPPGDWQGDRPGLKHHITAPDLPKPDTRSSISNTSRVVPRPRAATPQVPAGFKAEIFAEGLDDPRVLSIAPNGDIFVAETASGMIRVLRAADGAARPALSQIYARELNEPFGIAFYPRGANPRWVYVANTDGVVRFAYKPGDIKASGKAESIVADLPHGHGHSTRNIVFSQDDKRMLVSVGSASNVATGMGTPPDGLQNWVSGHALGASWGDETDRAAVLSFDPLGGDRRVFATGIRNCVGLAVHPATGDVWCSTNERDALGDNLVPDYITRVREGAFYGWPWFYIGDNQDPRHPGARADLKDKVTAPDVLIQAHSASLGLTFYNGAAFPAEFRGDGFAAEHGSWNRSKRTGYKVIRVRLKDGVPTGEYEDFVTGFVVNDSDVWGRPVGIAVARDGALLVSEDANGTIWRISRKD
jgi:glucose/arabinose dehydrogenase